MAPLQKCLALVFVSFILLGFIVAEKHRKYQPTWSDLDSRPLPTWYDDVKFGIFIHWGVFSVPSFGSEWFWSYWKAGKKHDYVEFMEKNYPPNFSYQDFAREFTAEFFNATEWAQMFKDSGAKYVVLTSKHHEGFTMWPSKHAFSWNALDTGPHRDLLGELAAAVRNEKLTFGVYYSLYEWFNPMYLTDRAYRYNTSEYATNKAMAELHELIHKYRPEVIWSDGDWEAEDSYWKSKEFLAWLYNESPVQDTVVANDRWGKNIPCHHGDVYTCTDRYNPGVLQPHKWENCMTIDKKSWGFRRNAKLSDYLSVKDLIHELVMTVSCGGNLLMNVGPTKDGIISPIYQERLQGIGNWLKYNGEAIYSTRPWTHQNDSYTPEVWYTKGNTQGKIYITFFNWPDNHQLQLRSIMIPKMNHVVLLGEKAKVPINTFYDPSAKLTTFKLPPEAHQGLPAWVLEVSSNSQV